jgi:hypothetical protein
MNCWICGNVWRTGEHGIEQSGSALRAPHRNANTRRTLRLLLSVSIIVTIGPLHAEELARKMQSYSYCMSLYADQEHCLNQYGRDAWAPMSEADPKGMQSCAIVRDTLRVANQQGWDLSWKVLFFNERCFRLGLPRY